MKERNGKLDFIKLKTCSLKDTTKKMKKQATGWEKIFAKPVSHKDLYPGYILRKTF